MCGYVKKATKFRNVNQILAAIEASIPGLQGKLGTFDATGKPSTGLMATKNRDGSYKYFDPKGGLNINTYGYSSGNCHVVIPKEALDAAGVTTNSGLGLTLNTSDSKDLRGEKIEKGTFSMQAYDGDMRRGAFDEAFNSQVFLSYNSQQAKKDLSAAGATILSANNIEIGGKPAVRVISEIEIMVDEAVAQRATATA